MSADAAEPAFASRSMAYVLQPDSFAKSKAAAVARLAACDRDLIVLEHAYGTAQGQQWTPNELAAIRRGKPGRKVVAYISIGEAEDYRPYWHKEWDADKDGRPDAGAPKFLCAVNPEWKGNYKVKYWHKDWQAIIEAYLDEIVAQGFDGMYMDIVDAFEFFEFDPAKKDWIDDRKNPETGNTYRQDMIAWVLKLAGRARTKAGPGFLVIPQNGTQLLADATFLKTIDAVGVEDLFTNGNKKQQRQEVANRLSHLQYAKKAGKPVLLIEYGTNAKARAISQQGATQHGLVLLLTDRQLTGKDLREPK